MRIWTTAIRSTPKGFEFVLLHEIEKPDWIPDDQTEGLIKVDVPSEKTIRFYAASKDILEALWAGWRVRNDLMFPNSYFELAQDELDDKGGGIVMRDGH